MNLAAYVDDKKFDFENFKKDVKTAIRFLDNVLEVNKFALEDNRQMSMKLRRLGLGVMGLADALIKMGHRYDSAEGREFVADMIAALRDSAHEASKELAKERGAFPDYSDSSLSKAQSHGLSEPRRNVAVLTVAPTGTTSMIMGVSSGIEPIFAPFIYRKVGSDYMAMISPLFQELLAKHPPHDDYSKSNTRLVSPSKTQLNSKLTTGGDTSYSPSKAQSLTWDLDKVVEAVQANHGSVQGLEFIPQEIRDVLVCAHDINPEDHVKMQGVVQRTFDRGGECLGNSLSKTINMPNSATVEDVYQAYRLAFKEGCKGITVYRDGSRQFQVLNTSSSTKTQLNSSTKTQSLKKSEENSSQQDNSSTKSHSPTQPQNSSSLPGGGDTSFNRPARLTGFTDTVKLTLPSGDKRSFYVTLNSSSSTRLVSPSNSSHLPTEVFIVAGKAGDEVNADAEALGRLTSIALQYGVPAEAIVRTLRGINGGMYGSYQGRMVASKADIIAVALETAGVENVLQKDAKCPSCGHALTFSEGCQTCNACGYSKCG